MAKFVLPNQSSQDQPVKSSIRIPSSMLARVEKDMEASGYNRKQRNQWIVMVIRELLERPDFANLVAEEFIVPGSTESIPLSLPVDLDTQINAALEVVRQEESINKDRSAFIRTAITQRLMARAGQQMAPVETLSRKIAERGGEA